MPIFLSLLEELCAPSRLRTSLKLIDEESASVRPNEIEKLVSELPREENQRRMYDREAGAFNLLYLCLQCSGRFLRVHVAPIDTLPIDVLHERLNVFCRRCAVVHVIRVLIHIEHKQRQPRWSVVHVIPRPVDVQLTGVEVMGEDHPA